MGHFLFLTHYDVILCIYNSTGNGKILSIFLKTGTDDMSDVVITSTKLFRGVLPKFTQTFSPQIDFCYTAYVLQ